MSSTEKLPEKICLSTHEAFTYSNPKRGVQKIGGQDGLTFDSNLYIHEDTVKKMVALAVYEERVWFLKNKAGSQVAINSINDAIQRLKKELGDE